MWVLAFILLFDVLRTSQGLSKVIQNVYYNENCEGNVGSSTVYGGVEEGKCMTNSIHSWSSGVGAEFRCASFWQMEAKMYFRNNASVVDVYKACDGNPGLVQNFYSSLCYRSQIQPVRSMKYEFDSCFLDVQTGKILFSTMVIGFVFLALLVQYGLRSRDVKKSTMTSNVGVLENSESPPDI